MVNKCSLINKIDHIGIAVKNIDKSLNFYTTVLQLQVEKIEIVESESVKVAFIDVDSVSIELIEPLNKHSPIYLFLTKYGEGVHHIAFHVKNIDEQYNRLRRKNISIINDIKYGARNKHIFFVHPHESSGVLYEFCSDVRYERGMEK